MSDDKAAIFIRNGKVAIIEDNEFQGIKNIVDADAVDSVKVARNVISSQTKATFEDALLQRSKRWSVY